MSTVTCVALTLLAKREFDFALIKQRTGDFDAPPVETTQPETLDPAGKETV